MSDSHKAAINALDVEARIGTTYPEPFRKEVAARSKRALVWPDKLWRQSGRTFTWLLVGAAALAYARRRVDLRSLR